jgi:ABC-2 type transport system ATP-binding protein
MIEAINLSKTFYVHRKAPGLLGSIRSLVRRERIPKHAVRGASFTVGEGEIVGLIGANGAGKTTLVKMLAGIIHPTSGDARVLGFRPWERDNRFRRQVSLIMGQKAQLWWDLPAADCFLLLREIYEIPRPVFQERLDYLTSVLGVRDELNVQIRRLSLGERMKMELMAALLHAPRAVYLDEPTIGLDLTAQRAIREFVLRYLQEHRPAMILTSHYMEDIERLCERIVIIREGEIVYDGPLARVVERYASHKIVTARLDQPVPGLEAGARLDGVGRILHREELSVRVEVRRQDVAAAAGALLERLPVVDLSIDEEDVGTIIEKILRARREGEE